MFSVLHLVFFFFPQQQILTQKFQFTNTAALHQKNRYAVKISERPFRAEIQFTVNIREKEHKKHLQKGWKASKSYKHRGKHCWLRKYLHCTLLKVGTYIEERALQICPVSTLRHWQQLLTAFGNHTLATFMFSSSGTRQSATRQKS